MVYGKDTDLEKQHLLLSAKHVKIYPSGHHFSPKLPPALEGRVSEERFAQTVETINDMWSPSRHLSKLFLASILLMMVSFVAPFVLILHWVTPREHLMSLWIPIDIALVLLNISLFLVILFRSTKTKSKIGAFLDEENVHYNRVGLNLRLVQERTLAGFAGDMSLYVDLLQSANTYGPHPTSIGVSKDNQECT